MENVPEETADLLRRARPFLMADPGHAAWLVGHACEPHRVVLHLLSTVRTFASLLLRRTP
jgi:hypothetical protein